MLECPAPRQQDSVYFANVPTTMPGINLLNVQIISMQNKNVMTSKILSNEKEIFQTGIRKENRDKLVVSPTQCLCIGGMQQIFAEGKKCCKNSNPETLGINPSGL